MACSHIAFIKSPDVIQSITQLRSNWYDAEVIRRGGNDDAHGCFFAWTTKTATHYFIP